MILEKGFYVTPFTSEKEMYILIEKHLSLNEVIRLRNYLTEQIEESQKRDAESVKSNK